MGARGNGKWVIRENVIQVAVVTSKGLATCGGSSDVKGTQEMLELCKGVAPM